MSTFNVFLEINEGGNCFAHVPSLPGCMLRAGDEETAVNILPQIIGTGVGGFGECTGSAAPDR